MSQAESLTLHLRQAFIRLVANRTGLKIRNIDYESFQDIILRRAQLTGLLFPEAYYSFLESETLDSRQEWEQIVLEITNNESFFFRDKGQFRLLKEIILPRLIQQKAQDKTLYICSAGCSTGEEPYSIAILLKELIPDLEDWTINILGIDINSAAIKKATAGVYRSWSFRSVDKTIQQQFFQEINGEYQIHPYFREMVTFRTANLLKNAFSDPKLNLKNIDLILCRNVFIYFDELAIRKVLKNFYEALVPHGYLLVGHSELYSQNPAPFEIEVFEESVAYQRPKNRDTTSKANLFHDDGKSSVSQNTSSETAPQGVESIIENHNSKMHEAALKLLRNLPADMRITRLGDRTVSELILELENN
ncbi:methyltransferase domain-containing protein [Oscillatoria sp. CS-180]|uniref:CheR family methyltransferase n=1 Tax=Oscillatoria sp. CS-180 TaxID=3021720 RepID=UPI00233037BE|nr:CheR family methyltransferase [Oscillatoria sp. CS-180]MDB9528303.1 methyltransferase domain-containing protein [Oscillatoria sp. CS-180]